ncbi:hypothetical protein WJX81_000536 [Elliptochloris bilobata]|uniref:DUF7876 domain-containing protein n=1 Tax=Elliptochloris bilobata TaxID=381761 RepID=A0AAW1RH13_9CHLO
MQDPAGHDTRYATALQNFTRSSILAFECNWSEASLERELADHPECSLFCCIIWLTLLQLPRKTVPHFQLPSSVVGAGVTVSAETTAQWGGFVCLIVFAYLEKRWAWYNLERLQLEILVSSGRAVPPAAVAELAQLVYTTLNQVAPQWPSE